MNKCHFMGRLTDDPTMSYTKSETPVLVANYSLAVDRRIKKKDEPSVDFVDFVAYGKTAEFVERYLKKGTKIIVTARYQKRSYDREGKKVYVHEFIVEEQEFAESKRAAEGNKNAESEPAGDDFMQIPAGEQEQLPFN